MAQRFRVKQFNAAIWDRKADQLIDAETAHDAAELVAGRPLIPSGVPGRLRAQVRRQDKPGAPLMFYDPPSRP
jgi:hypothetical protein